MATIKSYTDLEQSKKLAEILPIESADMCWTKYIDNGDITSLHATVNYGIVTIDYPCWSLTALFKLLPKSARLEKGNVTELYRVILPVELETSDWYIDPIDACVAMIERLHELKMF